MPLRTFLHEAVVPYEADEVTRLILDTHDAAAFAPVAHLTVGGLRDHLLGDATDAAALAALAPGLTPEMVAALSKICRNQDLMLIAAQVPGGDRPSAPRSACPAGSPRGCSPTIPRTTRPASWPASWTGCCSAAATR